MQTDAGPKVGQDVPLRPDLRRIARQIRPGARVLDLGCGSGDLLRHLMTQQGCTVQGVEHDPQALLAAVAAGVPVVDLDIDRQLNQFGDGSFDVVVLSRTLQAVRHPVEVLRQMSRIGTRLIVSMPNFAYWPHRLTLLRGRMPRSTDLPFEWFDTPNLHHATLNSLEALFDQLGLLRERRFALAPSGNLVNRLVNLRAGSAIYVLRSLAH
ncbi:MAG: methionine biosynthesis protein MetW [Propionibacteriaceae bacterium]|nr:methionine biosynthesis protein MetW [Propionibacteriaceae bacterium]